MFFLLWRWDNRLCLGSLQKRQGWEEGLVEACCICGFINACGLSRVVGSDWVPRVSAEARVNADGSGYLELKTSYLCGHRDEGDGL